MAIAKLFRNEPVITENDRFTIRVYEYLDQMNNQLANLAVTVENQRIAIAALEARVTALEA